MIYLYRPSSRPLAQQVHHHWKNPLNLPILLREIVKPYRPRQRTSFPCVPALLPFLFFALRVQIGYAKFFDPFTNNQAVTKTLVSFIAFFSQNPHRSFFFQPEHASARFVALPEKTHFCHTPTTHRQRERGNEGELGWLALEEQSGILRRQTIGICRANIASYQLIHRAQLLIVFKTSLGLLHRTMTQGKRTIEHHAHESKDRHCENHLDQGETFFKFFRHRFVFLTRRYVRNSTGRSRPASVTRMAKVISFNSQADDKDSVSGGSRTGSIPSFQRALSLSEPCWGPSSIFRRNRISSIA